MQIVDDRTGARALQAMVPMRDGTRLNTFAFHPAPERVPPAVKIISDFQFQPAPR